MATRKLYVGTTCSLIACLLGSACSGGSNGDRSPIAGGTTSSNDTFAIGGVSVTGGTSQLGSGVGNGGTGGASGMTSTGGNTNATGAGGDASTTVGGGLATGGASATSASANSGGVPAGGASFGGSANSSGTATAGGTANRGGATSLGGNRATGGNGVTGGAATAGGGTTITSGTAGGAGIPYKGVANSPCAARTALKVSWYYNWEQAAKEPCASPSIGGEFVPMVWGHTNTKPEASEQAPTGIANAVAAFVSRGNKYALGFNEPDNSGQSNLSVATAISLWPSFANTAISVGSPATQANTTGVAWMKDFMSQVEANAALRVDFLAIHWYGWNTGSCEANASTLESYIKQIEALPGNRPIWLTEWGCLHDSAPDVATTQAHVTGAIKMFAKHPRLVRYAWYPWADNHALNNSDGSLTTLGEIYAAAPAYK